MGAPALKEKTAHKKLRQDRIQTSGEPLVVRMEGLPDLSVLDYSATGISVLFEPQKENSVSLDAPEFTLFYDEIEVQTLTAKLVRQEKLPNGRVKASFTFTHHLLRTDLIDAAMQTQMVVKRVEKTYKSTVQMPERFVGLTLSLKSILENVREQLNHIEAQMRGKTELTAISEMQSLFAQSLARKLRPYFEKHLLQLSDFLSNQSDAVARTCFEFFREQLSKLIYESPFSERSLKKPLGYAGDFELMNMLYRDEPLGNDLFAKFVHFYIINMPGGQAVRNRGDYLLKNISRTLESTNFKCRILSVASGPAMELQNTLKNYADKDLSKVTICLLDQDPTSLKFAQRKLMELQLNMKHPPEFEFLNFDIKSLFRQGLEVSEFDLIFSAGLFDYFSDPVARLAAEKLFELIVPSGTLIIGNFDVSSPSRFFMEMAWDWNLIYRSEQDLNNLFSSLKGKMVVEKEAAGVNLFSRIIKT